MAGRIAVGDKLPFFLYDTPYSAQNRFRDLLAQKSPLVLIFMANFGHPITRTFASRYAESFPALRDGGLALVVRSRADKLSRSIGPDTLPYPLLCDADGVLYEYLDIPQSSSTLMTYSLEGWRILRQAKKQGYRAAKGALQQLPLTLILDRDGTVLFCHYGASLTDVPEDCEAMQSLLEELDLIPDVPDIEPEAFRQAYGTHRRTATDEESSAALPGNSRQAARPRRTRRAHAAAAEEAAPTRSRADHPPRRDRSPRRRAAEQPVREYGTPDLDKTSVVSLFDDPYSDD